MSELTKSIKELIGEPVVTLEYLDTMALGHVGPQIPLERKIWPGYIKSGLFTDIRIGGYGDPNGFYGAGPTRLMDHATYVLRLIATRMDLPLVKFGSLSKELETAVDWLKSACSFFGDEHVQNISRENKHLIIDSGNTKLNKNIPVYLEGIITNVRREGFSHIGNLSLYATVQLGHGMNYLTKEEYDSNESLKTKDVLSNVKGTGAFFRAELLRSMNALDVNATLFGMKDAYKRWLLTVDNV